MKYYFLALFALSLICCKSKKADKAILIDLSKVDDRTFNINDLNIIDTIRLEETENSHLKKIHKIALTDQYIFVLDKSLQKVFQFNKTGDFINSYAPYGDAPHQVDHLNDFTLDKENDLLYILSVNNRKILQFNFEGNFIKTKRIGFETYDIDLLGSGLFITRGAFYDEEGFNSRLYDFKDQKTLEKFSPFPDDIFPVDFGFVTGGTSYQNGYYLYNDPISNRIKTYDHHNRQLRTKYDLKFENQWPQNEQYEHKKFLNKLGSNDFNYLTPYFFESKNWFFLKYNQPHASKIVDFRYLYYNKVTDEKYVFELSDDRSDLLKNTLFLEGDIFFTYLKDDMNDSTSKTLESNPYIIKYKLNLIN